MAKLEKYDKNTQAQIKRYIEGKKKLHGDSYFTEEFLANDIKRLFGVMVQVQQKFKRERPNENLENLLQQMIPNWMKSISAVIFDYAFYKRILDDDLATFLNGLYTSQRILFLGDKRRQISGDSRSYIMINVRGGLAYYDEDLVKAYLSQIPAPFNDGYGFYVSLANALYSIFSGEMQKAADYLKQRIEMKTLKKYEESMLVAVKAIADKDEDIFLSELGNLLNLYPKQHFYNNLADYINIEAIGLYNLAEKIWGRKLEGPRSEFWDAEFVKFSKEHQPDFVIDFSNLSQLFAKWLLELPVEINMIELIGDIETSMELSK